MRNIVKFIVCLVLVAFFTSCSKWSWDTQWRSGTYRLIAIDIDSQMSLIEEHLDQTIVGATIFAVGADQKYIVLKQHPSTDSSSSEFDRMKTFYFVVERRHGSYAEQLAGVRGPLDEVAFQKLHAALNLPAFTKTFKALE